MNKIEFLQVTIQPWHYVDVEQKLLEVEVRVNGTKYNFQRTLSPDDLTSFFDQLFDLAREQVKANITATLK